MPEPNEMTSAPMPGPPEAPPPGGEPVSPEPANPSGSVWLGILFGFLFDLGVAGLLVVANLTVFYPLSARPVILLLILLSFLFILVSFMKKDRNRTALGFCLGVVLTPLVVFGLLFGTCLVMLGGGMD